MSDWNAFSLSITPSSQGSLYFVTSLRPQQWSDQSDTVFARTFISEPVYDEDGQPTTNTVDYFFDAVIRAEHTQSLRVTEHPVQTGACIVDHAYQMPARLTLEIGMSDAMDTFMNGQFSGDITKSVSAYQTLLDIQSSKKPLQVVTRLNVYDNMVIEHIHAADDFKTLYGLRAMVSLRQIITAQVSTETVSVRPQASGQSNSGVAQPTSPTGSALSKLPDLLGTN